MTSIRRVRYSASMFTITAAGRTVRLSSTRRRSTMRRPRVLAITWDRLPTDDPQGTYFCGCGADFGSNARAAVRHGFLAHRGIAPKYPPCTEPRCKYENCLPNGHVIVEGN